MLWANFDTQKSVCKTLGIAEQSACILNRGKKEVARTIGDNKQ